ncbi:hypothetical protein ACA910_006697 [Epithemia clementina (nom. ined.)]
MNAGTREEQQDKDNNNENVQNVVAGTAASDLLQNLQTVEIEFGNERKLKLLALPERLFHAVTSSHAAVVQDGTGTRLYSAGRAFLFFVQAFYDSIFVRGSVIELGAGIGACSILLFQLRQQRRQQRRRHTSITVNDLHDENGGNSTRCHEIDSILATDGESLTVEILKRNIKNVVAAATTDNDNQDDGISKPPLLTARKLQWSQDESIIARQLLGGDSNGDNDDKNKNKNNNHQQDSHGYRLHSFDFVLGTDLLYYRIDVHELVATVNAVLVQNKPGLAFLPGLVRVPDLPHHLVAACQAFGLELVLLDLTRFIDEKDLEGVSGWYNIHFFVLKRQGTDLPQAWREALEQAGQAPFHWSDDDDHNDGDHDDGDDSVENNLMTMMNI